MLDDFKRPPFVISIFILCLFAWAFGENVGDDTMKGALIGAFNLAIGYYLGSVVSNQKATENTGKAFEAIKEAARAGTPAARDAIRPGDTVKIENPSGEEEA